jgi:hypothetical protein
MQKYGGASKNREAPAKSVIPREAVAHSKTYAAAFRPVTETKFLGLLVSVDGIKVVATILENGRFQGT